MEQRKTQPKDLSKGKYNKKTTTILKAAKKQSMIDWNMFCKLKVVDFLRIVLCLLLSWPLETTTNNQEVKRIYTGCKMWIIYPKITFTPAWAADLSPICSLLSVLLNFKNTSIRIYKISVTIYSTLINLTLLQRKSLIFY